jgi:hypothetical protein
MRKAMLPRHHPRTLFEQAQWRILRRRARLSGKTIEELMEEERRPEGLTIEPAAVAPGLSPSDLEAVIRDLVPVIAQGVRGGVAEELKASLEQIAREASKETGDYIAQEVARRLAAQGVVSTTYTVPAAPAPAAPGAPKPAEPPARKRVAFDDIQGIIDMLNQQGGGR